MLSTKSKPEAEDPLQLIQRAIAAYDAQIADMQAKRAQLVALVTAQAKVHKN